MIKKRAKCDPNGAKMANFAENFLWRQWSNLSGMYSAVSPTGISVSVAPVW